MSEPKLISPLLDGFVMGAPMSEHDGVCCCPAMKENSDQKYIVKVISVPASQRQLDALLLTGAFKDPGEAMDYFKDLAGGIVKEAALLKKLSKLEGFLSYEGWQVVPMENNDLGYEVYLYSQYRQSLDKYTRKNLMTHLGAVNLGLDLCAALVICRRAGRIFVDLKPSNVFISEDKEYRIGDLGFADMGSLKYTSLPTKYRSAYTAPELHDPMNTLNTTADIYSVGMILYQIYNNGKLPFEEYAAQEAFPTPENADYEIAEIIMKAIAPDPADRWQNPTEMGQALVAYMQRNTVNDVPITPPTAQVGGFASLSGEDPEKEEPVLAADQEGKEFDFMSGIVSDETAPGEEDAEGAEDRPLSDETTSMLAQAADLIDHEIPAAAAVADDKELPSAAPSSVPAAEESPKPAAGEDDSDLSDIFGDDEDDLSDDEFDDAPPVVLAEGTDDEDDDEDDEDEDEAGTVVPGKKKGWVAPVIIGMVLALLLAGGFFFYRNYYLISVDRLNITPFESQVTVSVDTEGDLSLFTVVCTDIYGNVQRLPLSGNEAVFTDLLPDTQYKIQLEVDGFHALVGSTASSFSSSPVTTITGLTAVTGETDGSAVLSFQVEGPGTDDWVLTYSTEGEAEQTLSFSGNTVTVNGLTLGKSYRFLLTPGTEIYMTGENSLDFTASSIILAENVAVTDYADGTLRVQWNAPEDVEVESWIVRCYSDDGQSETLEVTDTTTVFSGIDSAKAYTVEVAAKGMTQTVRSHVSANPTKITGFYADESDVNKLVISWEYEGSYPEGGWILMYTVDNLDKQMVINCDGARAEINPRVPGAVYHIELKSASGSTIFGNTYEHACAPAEKFAEYEMLVDYSEYYLCKTPDDPDWKYSDVKQQDYTTEFAPGDKVSMIIKTATHFIPRENISILFAIRDKDGNLLGELSEAETVNWYQLWVDHYPYTTLDIPQMPKEPGDYQLCLYFNGKYVTVIEFTISE